MVLPHRHGTNRAWKNRLGGGTASGNNTHPSGLSVELVSTGRHAPGSVNANGKSSMASTTTAHAATVVDANLVAPTGGPSHTETPNRPATPTVATYRSRAFSDLA